jgi:rhomboid family GlyGly-CTERM serine protease
MPSAAPLRISYAATAFALVCLALAALPQVDHLAFDRQAILAGEVWRLWSGHLVHFSFQQLFLDVSTLLLAGAVAEKEFGLPFVTRVLLFGMPAISFGLLLLAPELAYYRGASSVVMLLAFVAGAAFWSRRPGLRAILFMLGLLVGIKAVLDAAGLASDMSGLPAGVQVAWQAHVLGAGMGWASARLKLKNLQ